MDTAPAVVAIVLVFAVSSIVLRWVVKILSPSSRYGYARAAMVNLGVVAVLAAAVVLAAVTLPWAGSRMSSTTRFQRNSIRGFLKARSCMILEARRLSRRWTTP